MKRAGRTQQRIRGIFSAIGIALLLVGGGYVFINLSRYHLAPPSLRWSEDPALPETVIAVVQHPSNAHGVTLLCDEIAVFAEKSRDALAKTPRESQGTAAAAALRHWEAIEDARQRLGAMNMAPEAVPAWEACGAQSTHVGEFLTTVADGQSLSPEALTPIADALRSAGRGVGPGRARSDADPGSPPPARVRHARAKPEEGSLEIKLLK